jgi:ribonuclease HII
MKARSVLESFFEPNRLEAGCDEAGRGCLAGPVVAASVILPPDFSHEWLNDSKQLSEKKRHALRPLIEKEAIAWSVAYIDHVKIDEINILNASILAMHEAVDALQVKPDFLLIDGNRFHPHAIPHLCFVKGDGRYKSIAAASILAKTYRDDFMETLHVEYPMYDWFQNKGYPTVAHRNAVLEHGFSPYHRLTFKVKPFEQLEIQFE